MHKENQAKRFKILILLPEHHFFGTRFQNLMPICRLHFRRNASKRPFHNCVRQGDNPYFS